MPWGAAEAEEVGAALRCIDQAIDLLAAAPWQRLAESDLIGSTRVLERMARRLQGPQIAVVDEIAQRGIPDRRGFASPAAFLSDLLTITSVDAADRVRAARMTVPQDTLTASDIPAALPLTADAIREGSIGPDQVRVITRGMAAIPSGVDEATRGLCESTLVEEARQRSATKLQLVADQLLCIVDPDGSDRDLDRSDRAEFTIGARRGDGLTAVRGLLDVQTVEHLRQAIEPLAAPAPSGDGRPDLRSAATRRAQALGELARRWLGLGSGPSSRGVRPHATIICTLEQLRDGVGGAILDYAGTAGAALTRLITCDADVALHAVDLDGRFIDGTKEFRLFNAAQRRALAVRDGGCAWPGCDTPAAWTDAHHIRHWADGGKTELDNAVLLCAYHHGFIHRASCEWQVRLNRNDARPEFLPPSWLDPEQRPRRNRLNSWRVMPVRVSRSILLRT